MEEPGGSVVAEIAGIGKVEMRLADGLEGQIEARDLGVAAAKGSDDKQVVGRIREDDPFSAARLDERADGEAHPAFPKMLGYLAKVWSHDDLSSNRNVMIR